MGKITPEWHYSQARNLRKQADEHDRLGRALQVIKQGQKVRIEGHGGLWAFDRYTTSSNAFAFVTQWEHVLCVPVSLIKPTGE